MDLVDCVADVGWWQVQMTAPIAGEERLPIVEDGRSLAEEDR